MHVLWDVLVTGTFYLVLLTVLLLTGAYLIGRGYVTMSVEGKEVGTPEIEGITHTCK